MMTTEGKFLYENNQIIDPNLNKDLYLEFNKKLLLSIGLFEELAEKEAENIYNFQKDYFNFEKKNADC
jgi:hypothetical protein